MSKDKKSKPSSKPKSKANSKNLASKKASALIDSFLSKEKGDYNKKTTTKAQLKKAKKRKRLIIELAVAVILIFTGYIFDTQYYIFTDFIENSITNRDPDKIASTVPALERAEGDVLIHFVDVGQGDCAIIQLPDGKNMIIDGGPRKAKNNVLNFIQSYKIDTFDYLILTHTDEDHVGSLDDVILNTKVLEMFVPDISTNVITTTVYRDFITAANNEEGAIINYTYAGLKIEAANYSFVFFTPTTDVYEKVKKNNASSINTVSPIMIFTYGDPNESSKKVIFTGDATKDTEASFLNSIIYHSQLKNEVVDVDILKVAHHGSDTSTTQDFLTAIKPEISIISVGAGNSYGHPNPEIMTRLGRFSEEIYRTDIMGNITVILSPNEEGIIEVSIEKTKFSDNSVKVKINITEKISLSAYLFNKKSILYLYI